MKLLLNLFYTCIALTVILAAMEGATAQTTDSDTPAWKACAASPTASCIAELVLSRTPAASDDELTRRHLIHARASAQVAERWLADSSKDETTKVSLRMAELSQQVGAAMLEANRNESMAAELKAQLQIIDAALPAGMERHGRPVTRTDIYLDAAELIAKGVRASVFPAEGASSGWPEVPP